MKETAQQLIQLFPGQAQLATFADRLRNWLIDDLNASDEPAPDFTESRAKALLRAADLLDDPTRHSFERLVEQETAVRIALFDLLESSKLADNDEVKAMAAATAAAEGRNQRQAVEWLSLATAAYAWKREYPLYQLDPASPPASYSPAGQVLKQTATWIRRQVQRSATEREKLGRTLLYDANAGDASLEQLRPQGAIAPLPPHFRPPIPVRYPEVSRETLQVETGEAENTQQSVTRGEPIKITRDDLEDVTPRTPRPQRQEPIQITTDQVREQPQPSAPSPRSTQVTTPSATVSAATNFTDSIRKTFGRGREPMKSTKLRVVVQEHPDGPGLYGLQVRVTCKGIKSHVAGTTNREGVFTCELPVPLHSGLTYDVDVTWPRDMESETERKSITLNADRTEFTVPFYHRLNS